MENSFRLTLKIVQFPSIPDMGDLFSSKTFLSAVIFLFSLWLTNGLQSWLLVLLSAYFTFSWNTTRLLDRLCPSLALISISLLANQTSNRLYLLACYTLHFSFLLFLSSCTLDIKTRSLQQPEHSVAASSKRSKLGITYYMEPGMPSKQLFDELLSKQDTVCDDIYVDLLRLLPLAKYKGKDPLEIILAEAEREPSGKFCIFINYMSGIPKWADFASVARGQEFYVSKFMLITYILGLGTLVGGFSCPEINEILVLHVFCDVQLTKLTCLMNHRSRRDTGRTTMTTRRCSTR